MEKVDTTSSLRSKRCGNCIHWNRFPNSLNRGLCTLLPPTYTLVMTPQGPTMGNTRPTMDANDGCGCWEPTVTLTLNGEH